MCFRIYLLITFLSVIQESILLNPIYEIVARLDSKKCYQCYNNCELPVSVDCPSTGRCFYTIYSNSTHEFKEKGCLELDKLQLCDFENKNVAYQYCHICEGDFCNSDLDDVETEDLGVSECYVCTNECEKPAPKHNCQEVLTAREGKAVKAACLSYEINQENDTRIYKGCVPDNSVIRSTCTMQNLFTQSVKCSMCFEELCNHEEEEEEELFVDECYFCEGTCDSLQIQNCTEVLGEDIKSKCIVIEHHENETSLLWRGCIEITDITQSTCNIINERGGNCTICDINLCNGMEEIDEENFVDECYFCEENCDSIKVQNCKELLGEDSNSKCIAAEFVNETGHNTTWRTCVEVTESLQNACNLINQQGGNCTICDTNLCNGREEIEEEKFVDECYLCQGKCDSITIQNCKEMLGEDSKSKCIAAEYSDENGETIIWRSCVEDNDLVQNGCNLINQQGGNCTICDTNLCNGKTEEDIEEDFVDECYYCENICIEPLQIHKCKEILGENSKSKCIVKEYIQDELVVTSRGCVEVNENILTSCEAINSNGGNCTICNTNLCNGLSQKSSGNMIDFAVLTLLGPMFVVIYNMLRK